jgi:DNA repair protein RadC
MNGQLPIPGDPTPRALSRLPLQERPDYRVNMDSGACNLVELIAALIGGPGAMDIAYRLLERYPNPWALSRASALELIQVYGIGPTTAARLRAAFELGRRALSGPGTESLIRSPADAASLLLGHMAALEQEYLYVILLNTRNRVIGAPIQLYHGSLNTSLIRVGEVFAPAIKANAAGIIVAHNHPSGDPSPSPEDVAVTRSIVEAGKLLDIELLDHLVIGHNRFVSLKERGLGFSSTTSA